MESNQELCRWLGENLMDWHVKCHGQTDFVPDEYYYNKSKEGIPCAEPCGSVDSWTPDVSMGQAWQIVTKVKAWPSERKSLFALAIQSVMDERMGMHMGWLLTPEFLFYVEPLDICLAAKRVLEESRKEQEA